MLNKKNDNFEEIYYQCFIKCNNNLDQMAIYAKNFEITMEQFLNNVRKYIDESLNIPEYVKVLDVISTLETKEEIISYLDSIKADINYLNRNFLSYYYCYRPDTFYLKKDLVNELKGKLTCYQNYLYRKLNPLRVENKDSNIVRENLIHDFINSNYSLTRFCFNNGLLKQKFQQNVVLNIKKRNKSLYEEYLNILAIKDIIKEETIKNDVLKIIDFIKENNNSISLIDFCLLTNYDISEIAKAAEEILSKEDYKLLKASISDHKTIDFLKSSRLTSLFKTKFTFNINNDLVQINNEADIYTVINFLNQHDIPSCMDTFKYSFFIAYN